jgi:hypothetical protein
MLKGRPPFRKKAAPDFSEAAAFFTFPSSLFSFLFFHSYGMTAE